MATRIPFGFRSVYRPVRLPTDRYPEVEQIVYFRDSEFLPTARADGARVWMLNLEHAQLTPEALHHLIVPAARRIRDGEVGQAALVIATSSQPLAEAIEDLARRHELALYLLPSVDTPLTEARPVGALSRADLETLAFLPAAGGISTSAEFAKATGLELPAAGNRFAGIHKKGFVTRVERPRRQGHQFIDFRTAVGPQKDEPIPARGSSSSVDFDVPESLRDAVNALAESQGRPASAVLADLWHGYVTNNYDDIAEEFRQIGSFMAKGDREGMRAHSAESVKKRAAAAAERARHQE